MNLKQAPSASASLNRHGHDFQLIQDTLDQALILLEPDASSAAYSSWLAAKVLLNLEVLPQQQIAVLHAAYYFLNATAQRSRQSASSDIMVVLVSVEQLLHLRGTPEVHVGIFERNQGLQRSLSYCRDNEGTDAKQVLAAMDKAVATADRTVVDSLYILLAEGAPQSPIALWFHPHAHVFPIPRPLVPPSDSMCMATRLPHPISTDPDLQTIARLACGHEED